MKSSSLASFRRKLATSVPLYGLWVTLEAPAITDIAAGLGLDWVVIDGEHGHLDWAEILEHVRATVRSGTIALICVPEASPGLIKRALDVGADGVVVPGVETASQLRSIVRGARHATQRPRRIGHYRAEQQQDPNASFLVAPIIQSARAIRNLGALLNVEGAEIFFFQPGDHTTSSGEPRSPEETAFTTAQDRIVRMIRKQGETRWDCGAKLGAPWQLSERRFQLVGPGFLMGT